MKRYVYTLHVKQKFTLPEIKKLGITKKHIQVVIENPEVLDRSEEPVLIAISGFTDTLSLCIAYRKWNSKLG